MTPVFVDTETQSLADLKQVGGRRYAEHSSTRLICAVFAWDDNVVSWVPDEIGFNLDPRIRRGANLPACVPWNRGFAAHNAMTFDRHIARRFFPYKGPWLDTLHMARAAGLPGSLDMLGERFTGQGKDPAQKILKKFMVPGRKGWGQGAIEAIVRYCRRDVELLQKVYDILKPHPFNDLPGVIQADEEINERGLYFDGTLAARIAQVSTDLIEVCGDEIESISTLKRGDLRSHPKMMKWLADQGVYLDNLRRSTVQDFLSDPEKALGDEDGIGISPSVARVLSLRNACLRITGAKLERASAICSSDNRIRDLFGYHGAHTGRWTSRAFQVQNLPRGVEGVDVESLIADLSLDTVRNVARDCNCSPDDVLSTLIRPCITAAPGNTLIVSDFNAVEARVIAWLAEEPEMLRIFREGEKLYEATAAVMFGVKVAEVTKGQRQAAKVASLLCQYGGGANKLGDFASMMQIDLAAIGVSAEFIVETWRDKFPLIAGVKEGEYRTGGLWKDVEFAFKAAINGGNIRAAKCRFWQMDQSVMVTLPSGRNLCYRLARLEDRVPVYGGDAKPTIVYQAPRFETTTYGGKLVENITQAVARDLLAEKLVENEYVVLHAHDEIVCEVLETEAEARRERLEVSMSTSPVWAAGMPLKAEAFITKRYKK